MDYRVNNNLDVDKRIFLHGGKSPFQDFFFFVFNYFFTMNTKCRQISNVTSVAVLSAAFLFPLFVIISRLILTTGRYDCIWFVQLVD